MVNFLLLSISIFSFLPKTRAQNGSEIIQYYFGSKVDTIINLALDSGIIKLEPDESLLMLCSNNDTAVYINLYKYCNSCPIYDSTGNLIYWRGYLAKHTNRFFLLNNRKIPVLFELDEFFSAIELDRSKSRITTVYRLFGEFEPQVNITIGFRWGRFYKASYIR
ncbi:MAG TPA: hypothetical protein DF296_10855 [Candidatus Margulisbacteria bacterium]|nr:hypothetical protein [Candidatus Margulisiibacteriota bacterium]